MVRHATGYTDRHAEKMLKLKIIEPDAGVNYVTIHPQHSSQALYSLNKQEVISLFREYGAILFRDFPLDHESFHELAASYCNHFIVNKASGREDVSPDRRIQTVNLGHDVFPLHPELASMPTRPDIAWFACASPPLVGGETLLCDGIPLVAALKKQTRDLLMEQSFRYKTKMTPEDCELWLGSKTPDTGALSALDETCPLEISVEDGVFYSTFVTPVLYKPLFSDQLAFGSFLLFARNMQGWKDFPTFEDGTEVPEAVCDELKQVSDALSVAHKWQQNDVLMVDNTRFLHGRNFVLNSKQRVIWTQFGYAAFIPDLESLVESQPWRRAAPN